MRSLAWLNLVELPLSVSAQIRTGDYIRPHHRKHSRHRGRDSDVGCRMGGFGGWSCRIS